MRTTALIIIGGGFSGIGMAIRLRQTGVTDFVILERASASGGTWRDNTYPGCACDVQSSLYSFSFAPNPDWSRSFSPQAEIWAYLKRCATDFDIDRHFAFEQNVTGAHWDELEQRWTVTTATDTWSAPMVVLANGALSDAVFPRIPGLETFTGTAFHSSQWDSDTDLRDKRVAVIGTGASAIQFVPKIQPLVRQLTVFQRTPAWVMPRNDRAIPEWKKSLFRRVPLLQRLQRATLYGVRELLFYPFRHRRAAKLVEWIAARHMRAQITDPLLREKLTPHYRIGCKRILVSDDFYPAVGKPNVTLVTDTITAIDAGGVVTGDGTHHDADVLIFGTGFRPTDPPLAPLIVGRDGTTLAEQWNGSPEAYMGTTIAGFPNLFTLLGPNTALGHSSVMLMVEAQIEHVLGVIALATARNSGAVEPRVSAQRQYVAWLDERLADTTWNAGGCRSWYLDRTGRNSTLWPDGVGAFRRTVTRVKPEAYHFDQPRGAPTPEFSNV